MTRLATFTGAVMLGASQIMSAQVRPAAAQIAVQHRETLASLGFQNGFGMVDPTQPHDFYFHGTDGVPATNGRLHLDLSLAVHDFRYAFVQILVNDVPRSSQAISVPSLELPLDLPLSAAELSHAFVKVSLRFGGRLTDDRCYDWRTNGSYIAVQPTSGVQYTYQPEQVTTIDGAWSVLPKHITVAIPAGSLTPALYRSAWQTGTALMGAGHTVTYAQVAGSGGAIASYLSPPADTSDGSGAVMIAGSAQLTALADSSARGANLLLTQVDGRPLLVVGDSFPAAQFLGEDWRHAAQSNRVSVGVARAERDAAAPAAAITFQQIGLSSVPRDLGNRAEWSFPFSVRDLAPGFVPADVSLDVVAGLSPDKQPTVAQLYLNDVLLRSTAINGSGAAQRISAELPRQLIGVDNTLRLVLQRNDANSSSPATGECRALPVLSPAEVLATSTITGRHVDELTEFLELPAVLRDGFDVYLPDSVLADPLGTLPFLARLGADVLPMADLGQLVFFNNAHVPAPARHFVLVDPGGAVAIDAPARYERGHLVVDDRHQRAVLDMAGSARSNVVELGRIGSASGLVVLPMSAGALATPASIGLSHGDLAFVSATGVDLVVDSRADARGVSRLGAPFGRYRYWAYSLMALALAIIIIYSLRLLRRHRS